MSDGDKIIEGLDEALNHARSRCSFCGFVDPEHAEHCPELGPTDETAPVAEPPPADRDHCGFVEMEDEARPDLPFATADPDFADIDNPEGELDMYKRFYAESARDYMECRQMLENVGAESTRITAELQATTRQRDFAMRQIDSLVQRLAASHVAQGLIDMAAAQGFVQKEILPINQALAQIGAQPQGE